MPPRIVLVETRDSEWLGGGRFFPRIATAAYESLGDGVWRAKAATLRSRIKLNEPVFYAMERVGWLTSGVDWALIGKGSESPSTKTTPASPCARKRKSY